MKVDRLSSESNLLLRCSCGWLQGAIITFCIVNELTTGFASLKLSWENAPHHPHCCNDRYRVLDMIASVSTVYEVRENVNTNPRRRYHTSRWINALHHRSLLVEYDRRRAAKRYVYEQHFFRELQLSHHCISAATTIPK